jgi:GNAT superfamily N-acetyltransferase
VIRFDCFLGRKDPPVALCPQGGRAVLKAWYDPQRHHGDDDGWEEKNGTTMPTSSSAKIKEKRRMIGRFGFTTERGPPGRPFRETVHDIYGIPIDIDAGVAAVVYMYVEPNCRKQNVGSLALEVISFLHAMQGCDFTVLVVDDDGSGRLIDWYERRGYEMAPKLQNVLGSPNGMHGPTMIAPTNNRIPNGCKIQWW